MKALLIFATLLIFASCSKTKPCNCGTIANDGIDNGCNWLEVRNDCTGNKKIFCVDADIWIKNHPGESICFTNEKQW